MSHPLAPRTLPDRRDRSSLTGRIQESLTLCTREGVAAQVMLGIMDYYLIPFALLLGASTQQIGLLVAIPNLLSSISQFFAVPAVRVAGNRRTLMLVGTAIQAGVLASLAAVAFFPVSVSARMAILTALVGGFRVLGSLIGPAWGSLVSEYLPENRRGHYFGRRSRIIGIAGLINVAFWGGVLHLLRGVPPVTGFILLFVAAALFRVLSFSFLYRMIDLPLERKPTSDFTFWKFIRRFRESNFVKYIFYIASMTFSIQLAAPYFSVYMLQVMDLSYAHYMAVHLSSVAMGFIAFPIWGRHADAVGNARVLKLTGLLSPLIPVLWTMAPGPYALMAVEALSGFLLGGFTLCTMNFIYDAVSPDKRVRCLSYFNLINGAAAFAGAAIGGALAGRLPSVLGHPLMTLFLLSASLRMLANLFLARHFHEVRASAEPVTSSELFFSVVGWRPLLGRATETGGELVVGDKEAFRRRSQRPRRQSEPAGRAS